MPFLAGIWAFLTTTLLGGFVLSIATSLVLTGVSALLTKKPKSADLSSDAQNRTVSVRQPEAPRRVIYGEIVVGGIFTFMQSYDSNQYLNLVYTLAGHRCQQIGDMYFDGVLVPLEWNSGGGYWEVTDGGSKFCGLVLVQKKLGAPGEAAFPWLVANSGGKWSSDHRQDGCASVFVRLKYDETAFASGSLPNITWKVQGALVYDPRGSVTAYSNNWALCVRDFLTNSVYGLGCASSEINDASVVAAANISDESVVTSSSLEARYACDGCFDADVTYGDVIRSLLTAGAGQAVWAGGAWTLYAGSWRAPSVTLRDADFRGSLRYQPRRSRRDACNLVKGSYVSAHNNWQASDFPAFSHSSARGYSSDPYLAEDGELIVKSVELPFTLSSSAAQRLAKIELERSRRQGMLQLPCKASAFKLAAGDTVAIVHPNYGWTEAAPATFEVVSTGLAIDASQDGPSLGVDLVLNQLDEDVYAWANTDDLAVADAPTINLPQLSVVAAPSNLQLSSGSGYGVMAGSASTSLGGVMRNHIHLTWDRPVDHMLNAIGVEYRKVSTDNILTFGNQFDHADWLKDGTGSVVTPDTDPGPFPDILADTFHNGSGGFGGWARLYQLRSGDMSGKTWRFSIWMKVASGTQAVDVNLSDHTVHTVANHVTVTTDWQLFACTSAGFSNTGHIGYGIAPANASVDIQVAKARMEDVSAGEPDWISAGRFKMVQNPDTTWSAPTSADIGSVDDGAVYDVRIYAVNSAGAKSPYVTYTNYLVGGATFPHASYRPTTNPLTAIDAGSVPRALIDAFVMRIPGVADISVSAGSVDATSGDYGATAFIYYDDPAFEGGAVVFHLSFTREEALNANGRFFVGSVPLPMVGTGKTYGNNDGGAGAQYSRTADLPPGTVAASGWNNPARVQDSDQDNYADVTTSGAPAIFTGSAYPTFSSWFSLMVAKIKHQFVTLAGTGLLELSKDGGVNWDIVRSVASADSAPVTSIISLPSTQRSELVQMRMTVPDAGATASKNAGTAANAGSGQIWSAVANAQGAPDAAVASSLLSQFAPSSQQLKLTNFSFAVPSGATIRGISVKLRCGTLGSGAFTPPEGYDLHIYIVKGGTVMTTVDRAKGDTWPGDLADRFYGGSSDLWGQTWANTDINASGFGVAVQTTSVCYDSTDSITMKVDAVEITVVYSVSGSNSSGRLYTMMQEVSL